VWRHRNSLKTPIARVSWCSKPFDKLRESGAVLGEGFFDADIAQNVNAVIAFEGEKIDFGGDTVDFACGMNTPAFTLFGMLVSFMSLPLALFCYAFPLVFNIIPGLLNATERALGFKL
jgi:hypothetical protein